MRVLAIIMVIAGLVLAIAPQFTNCEASGGGMATTTSAGAASGGMAMASSTAAARPATVAKMKCLWTARASLAVGIPLALAGALLFFSRRKETRRVLAAMGAVFGVFAILLPTSLIGTCASNSAVCNTTMLPIMLVAGGIALAATIAAFVVNEWKREEDVARVATAV